MKYSLLTGALMLLATNAHAAGPYPKGSIGVFNAGTWYLDTDRSFSWSGTSPLPADEIHYFGQAGDKPVVYFGRPCFYNEPGAIGITRGNNWYFTTNNLDYDHADDSNAFVFGTTPFTPTIWNTVPVTFSNGNWLIDWNDNHVQDSGDVVLGFGSAGQLPVIGLWSTTSGGTRIGTFAPSTHTWYVDYDGTNTWSSGDKTWTFGFSSTDQPVVMPYTDGIDRIGIFNAGNWYIDKNNNHVWDGPSGGDEQWQFGNPGDTPVVTRETTWEGECPID